ncbi:MAG: hypothetical protein WCA78_15700 [Rhizomicrobium sp.]
MGLPSLGFSSDPSSGATGGTINFAPIYTGTAADEAAAPVTSTVSSLLPWIAVAVVVYLLLKR